MRKDKGLNGDLDRLPMLTWIMFLKFLDDMERMRRGRRRRLQGEKYRPAIEAPYRWRDWAAKEDGITGDELIAFINQETAVRPDGKRAPGSSPTCGQLQGANGGDRRDVIATVFRGTVNRMVNGYLLRDVLNQVNGIHFDSSEEIHTLGHLYESMLKEMRDAAGDSGEFYTPRPVVRFMVEVIEPPPRGNRPRPGLRHRRLPRRDLSTIWKSSARRSRTAGHFSRRASSGAKRSRCRISSAR